MAVTSAMLQLVAALASTTFVLATGVEGLLGLGPAIFLVTAALAALPAGRAMDRFGRVPVLAAGFALGILGGVVTGLSAGRSLGAGVIAGFVLIGAANGIVLLSRAAAGDMYPPARRARGIAFVLSGAVFGAILGPAVFSPLLSGRALSGESLALLWLAGGAFMLTAMGLVLCVRPDPKTIAERLGTHSAPAPDVAVPLGIMLARPG